MQKFSIYIKSNQFFYWSINNIIYSILFACYGIILFKQKVLNLEENFIDKFFMWLTLIVFFIGLVFKFIGVTKIEPLRGKLEGYISFEKDSIIVDKDIYLVEEIRKIKISNDDYSGKLVNISKGNLGPALSNGTNNFIIIFLNSGKSKKYLFELINSDDFQKVRSELINYYLIGKLEFDDLTDILGETSRKEIKELEIEIKNKYYH